MNKCIDVVTKGFGMPAFNNDEIIIKSPLKGVEEKDAYDYSVVGCVEVAVPENGVSIPMSFINFRGIDGRTQQWIKPLRMKIV